MKIIDVIKLIVSAIIDIVGYASYLIPVWGELADVFFFAIEAAWIGIAYKSTKGAILGGAEELLPFTDFIPACLITHFVIAKKKEKSVK